jgi:hypothetical protein
MGAARLAESFGKAQDTRVLFPSYLKVPLQILAQQRQIDAAFGVNFVVAVELHEIPDQPVALSYRDKLIVV